MKTYSGGYGVNDDDRIDGLLNSLSKVYKDTYTNKVYAEWEEDEELVKAAPKVHHDLLLRDVMYELHKQGDGLDTLMALKNDQLRDWWATELAKIKKSEARAAAREKAKMLLSDDERKLLGMKF